MTLIFPGAAHGRRWPRTVTVTVPVNVTVTDWHVWNFNLNASGPDRPTVAHPEALKSDGPGGNGRPLSNHDSDATVIATVAVALHYAAIMIPYAGPAAIYDCILRVWHTRVAYVPARPVRRQVSIQVSKLVRAN
jgi:hypothetical protein